MSHLLQQKKKQILMTSHVLVMAAWEFVPLNSARPGADDEDRGRRIPALICTAPLSRALVANVFVQTHKHLQYRVVDFFLHDKVIPAFRIPILFVYCVLMDWRYSPRKKLIGTVQRISETMPHIQTLDIDRLSKLDGTDQQLALATALPKTLWSLRVSAAFHFGAGFVSQLAESCPFLQRLELRDVDAGACELMFSPDKNLFPNLRTLTVWTSAGTSSELYDRVFTSQVVSSRRLESLGFSAFCELDDDFDPSGEPFPAPSIKPLEHLRSISSLLERSHLSTVPDFSVLNCCSELTELLTGTTFTGNQQQQQQQQQIVVDLTTMPCLTSLGERTLYHCKGVHKLVLPPTLRTVGSGFCQHSTVEQIDFSLCADSLRFVDTERFLFCAKNIEIFSTLPLLAKIGTVIGKCFLCCQKLRHVDLSGLKGAVEIGDGFLASTAVEELDLGALAPTCTKIGNYFLPNCRSLKKVTGGLSSVTRVGKYFLLGAGKLQEFDFAAMKALASLDMEGFLHQSPLREEGTKILDSIIEQNHRKKPHEQQEEERSDG